MECLKETKKRISDEGGASPKRRKSTRAEPLVDFCERKQLAADREIVGASCKTTGTGIRSLANDESCNPSAAANEYCNVVEKLLNKWSAIKVFLFKTRLLLTYKI